MASYYVTTSGNDTTGDGSSGNPWATPGKAGGSLNEDDKLFIEEGTYTLSSSSSNVAGGRLTLPAGKACQVIGHASGDTDDYSARPVIDAGAITSINVITLAGSDGHQHFVFNVKVDGNKSSGVSAFKGGNVLWDTVDNCEAVDCPSRGFDVVYAYSCKSSYSGSKTGTGFYFCCLNNCWADSHQYGNYGLPGFRNTFSIFSNCTYGTEDSQNYRGSYANCVAYGNTNHGFANRNTATDSPGVYIACIAYGNGTYGWDFNQITGAGLIRCASGSNTSGRTDGNESFDLEAITLTADPFTNAAAGDFSLNNTAGGGALLRAAGYGVFGQTTNGRDVGAVQHEDPAGGGGAFPANLSGGIFQ